MRLARKYKPKKLTEVVGQPQAISQMLMWLSVWQRGRPLIIHGPPGTGKTAAVHALAAERSLELIELGNEDANLERILPAIKQHSLLRKEKLVVVEGAEQFQTKLLTKIVKESIFPTILFVDDVWKPKLRTLRATSEVIQFRKVHRFSIEKRLSHVSRAEKLSPDIDVAAFAQAAEGDMRAALIDMDAGTDAARDRATNIFEVLRAVFKGSHKQAVEALQKSDKDPHQVLWWIEANIQNEFTDPEERAAAFELLSRADVVKRKSMPMLAGLSSVKKGKAKSYTTYRPPRFRRGTDLELCAQLAAAMHCSVSAARKEMPFLKKVLN